MPAGEVIRRHINLPTAGADAVPRALSIFRSNAILSRKPSKGFAGQINWPAHLSPPRMSRVISCFRERSGV